MLGMGQKNPKRKNSPFGCPTIPLQQYGGDCFPVSENAENKPDFA